MATKKRAVQGADKSESEARRAAVDKKLVEALASGLTYSQAGEVAGCTSRTVARRMAEPTFAAVVSRARGERVAELTGQLTGLGSKAIEAIGECLQSGSPAERLRAAQLPLTMVLRMRSEVELEARFTAIEKRLLLTDSASSPSAISGVDGVGM